MSQAFCSRPDLIALEQQYESEKRFRRVEHDLFAPPLALWACSAELLYTPDQQAAGNVAGRSA